MRRKKKRNIPQMKQEKTPENKLNEMEASNLPETEFKIMVVRMLNELRGRMDEHNENLNSIKNGHGNHKKEPDRNEEYNN